MSGEDLREGEKLRVRGTTVSGRKGSLNLEKKGLNVIAGDHLFPRPYGKSGTSTKRNRPSRTKIWARVVK